MRSLKSGLLTFTIAGIFGMAAVIGCSAEGSSDVMEDQSGTEPADEDSTGTMLPPSSSGGSSSGGSSGTTSTKDGGKDSSTKDAGKDAGPPPPEPGDTCTQVDKTYTKSCGKCGKQEAICTKDAAGKLTVSEYGACLGETGVCVPGETTTEACGNCGTLTKTCNNYCGWTSSACGGQPANSCSPGTYEYTAAGCPLNQYRKRDCQTACTWTNYGTCAEPSNPLKLDIAGTVNGTVSGNYSLTNAKMSKRQPTYSCGSSASLSTETDHPYEVIEVKNPTAKTATITATTTGNPASFWAVVAAYPTTLPPTSDAELKACANTDYASTWAGISLANVSIPAGAKILVRVQAYDETSQSTYPSTGTFTLTLKTTALN